MTNSIAILQVFAVTTLVFFASIHTSHALDCEKADRTCLTNAILAEAPQIQNAAWRDQSYRELAKAMAAQDDVEKAMSLIAKIENPDTRAMTIRGIGMAAADQNYPKERYQKIFSDLRRHAETISHPPSYAIALTYIAMAQAFAGDNEGAELTAAGMENAALRNKAYAETAEIQAEKEDFDAAMKSISAIDDAAFRDKAYGIVSKILSDKNSHDRALKAAESITNPYKKTSALQYILDQQIQMKKHEQKDMPDNKGLQKP